MTLYCVCNYNKTNLYSRLKIYSGFSNIIYYTSIIRFETQNFFLEEFLPEYVNIYLYVNTNI